MRKYLRIGVAALLATSGLIATANSSSAEDPKVVVECDTAPEEPADWDPGHPLHTPRVTIPDDDNTSPTQPQSNDGIPLTGDGVLSDSNNCAEMRRTIVFVGSAHILNGVNFAGNGDNTTGTDTYTYVGDCVLVNWTDGNEGVAITGVQGCFFEAGTTHGSYGGPGAGQGNGIFNPIGECVENGVPAECQGGTPGYTGLDWAPEDQASCFNSDGLGVSQFKANGATEIWSADYTWNDSLDNLRGDVWADADADQVQDPGEAVFLFDAKIEAQADAVGAVANNAPLDTTAAGCLQKTAQALQDVAQNQAYSGTGATGLNDILIVGTASWNVIIPEILFP